MRKKQIFFMINKLNQNFLTQRKLVWILLRSQWKQKKKIPLNQLQFQAYYN